MVYDDGEEKNNVIVYEQVGGFFLIFDFQVQFKGNFEQIFVLKFEEEVFVFEVGVFKFEGIDLRFEIFYLGRFQFLVEEELCSGKFFDVFIDFKNGFFFVF